MHLWFKQVSRLISERSLVHAMKINMPDASRVQSTETCTRLCSCSSSPFRSVLPSSSVKKGEDYP